jgi:hypothetical protein
VLPTERLTWPGCLLDFQAVELPPLALVARDRSPPLMLRSPPWMLVLRLTLMFALPPQLVE